jgi:hypothetical protein
MQPLSKQQAGAPRSIRDRVMALNRSALNVFFFFSPSSSFFCEEKDTVVFFLTSSIHQVGSRRRWKAETLSECDTV